MDEVQRICEWLLEYARARAVWLLDAEGGALAHAGEARDVAAEKAQVHHAPVAGGRRLEVRYDEGASSLGLVRLRTRKACEDLDKALQRLPDGDGGSGAPAHVGLFKA